MAELLLNGKKLDDLKVSELKDELDKRELSKKGNKSALLDRLRKAVLEEMAKLAAAAATASSIDESVELDASEMEETAPSTSEQADESVTSGSELQEVVVPKKPTPGRKPGTKKRGRGGRIMSPRDKPAASSDNQSKFEDDSGLSLEESDTIKLETKLDSKTEPLEPITESVPSDLFTVDSDMKDEAEEDAKPLEDEEGDKPVEDWKDLDDEKDMGIPLHVDEGAMDYSSQMESSQDEIKVDDDDDDDNVVPEHGIDDLPDFDQPNQDQAGDDATAPEGAKDDAMEEGGTKEPPQEDKDDTKAAAQPESATIDSSFAPETEELLYEGDVENDHTEEKEGTPVMDEATSKENREQDLSLVLDIHVSGEMEDLQIQSKDEDKSSKSGEGASQGDKSAQCSLWVSGLSSSVSASDLKTMFSPFGSVSSAKVVAKQGSQSRFGHVTMKDEKEATKCIKELNGKELKGAKVTVEPAKGSAIVGKKPSSKESEGDTKSAEKSSSRSDSKSRSTDTKSSSSKSSKGTSSSDKSSSRKESSSSHRHRSSSRGRHSSPSHGSRDRRRRSRSRSKSPGSKASRPAARGELQRNLEMRLEPRLPEREVYLRRQLTLEQQEKDLMERIQAIKEREIREREVRQQALAEQERMFRQKERELKERELRERRRREELERILRQGDARERDYRERERRMKEEFQRQLRDQEMKAKHERQMRERDLLVQAQKEEQLRDQERKLQETKQQYFKLNKEKEILAARAAKAEQEKLERERQLLDIQQRERRERDLLEKRLMKEKVDQERMFLDKQKELEERARQQQQEFKRREMERLEVEKREWERERQDRERQDRERQESSKKDMSSTGGESSRDRDKHDHKSSKPPNDRATKRPFNDEAMYEDLKRPVRHDIRETLTGFHQGNMQQEGRSIRRESPPPRGYERGRPQEPVGYPAPSGRGGPGYGDRPPTSRAAGLPVTPNLPPELINAANKALQTIQRAATASIPDQHRQGGRPMPSGSGRPYGGGPPPASRPDPYPPRPGNFQGNPRGGQMGGYPPSQPRMHDDRGGRRVSNNAPPPYQGNYPRRY